MGRLITSSRFSFDDQRGAPQIISRIVRAQIGAMPEHRTVLHQAVAQKHALPGEHVVTRIQQTAVVAQCLGWNGRLRLIGSVGEQAEHEKTEQEYDDGRLHPPLVHQ